MNHKLQAALFPRPHCVTHRALPGVPARGLPCSSAPGDGRRRGAQGAPSPTGARGLSCHSPQGLSGGLQESSITLSLHLGLPSPVSGSKATGTRVTMAPCKNAQSNATTSAKNTQGSQGHSSDPKVPSRAGLETLVRETGNPSSLRP